MVGSAGDAAGEGENGVVDGRKGVEQAACVEGTRGGRRDGCCRSCLVGVNGNIDSGCFIRECVFCTAHRTAYDTYAEILNLGRDRFRLPVGSTLCSEGYRIYIQIHYVHRGKNKSAFHHGLHGINEPVSALNYHSFRI